MSENQAQAPEWPESTGRRKLSDEHMEKLAEGRRRRAEAIARGEIPAVSYRQARARTDRITKDPSFRESLASTPEFKRALDAALAEKLPGMLAALAQATNEARDQSPQNFANSLALQMAKFTGQGTGKTYVDPEELEKRSAARSEMMRLLRGYHKTGEMPVYRVIRQTQLPVGQFGPIVVEPFWRGTDRVQHDTEIDYPLIPNLCMQPLNEQAQKVFTQFERWIAAEVPEVSDPEWALMDAAGRSAAERGQSPVFGGVPLSRDQALGASGTTIRGAAAAAVIRNDPALRERAAVAPGPLGPREAAMIRRGEDPAVRKRQVYGTLTEPIELR